MHCNHECDTVSQGAWAAITRVIVKRRAYARHGKSKGIYRYIDQLIYHRVYIDMSDISGEIYRYIRYIEEIYQKVTQIDMGKSHICSPFRQNEGDFTDGVNSTTSIFVVARLNPTNPIQQVIASRAVFTFHLHRKIILFAITTTVSSV